MNAEYINELKRLATEMNNLAETIKEDTKEKEKNKNKACSEKYDVMKNDLEEMQNLVRQAEIENIYVTIPCNFTDNVIKEFLFRFPGTSINHEGAGLYIKYGSGTNSPNKLSFEGWLYDWDYSSGMIEQAKGTYRYKYLEKIFKYLLEDWDSLKSKIEEDFIKQYKLQLTDRVKKAIHENENV